MSKSTPSHIFRLWRSSETASDSREAAWGYTHMLTITEHTGLSPPGPHERGIAPNRGCGWPLMLRGRVSHTLVGERGGVGFPRYMETGATPPTSHHIKKVSGRALNV